MIKPAARMITAIVRGSSVGVGLVMVKLAVWVTVFPAASSAVIVMLCSPIDRSVNVQLPFSAAWSFWSRQYVAFACLFNAKFNGISELAYVVFFGDKTVRFRGEQSMEK